MGIQHGHLGSLQHFSMAASFTICGVAAALEVIAREKRKRSVAPISRVVRKNTSYSTLLKKIYSLLKELIHLIVVCPIWGAVLRS